MKKLLAIVLSLLMVMSLAVPAMAAPTYSITINNPAGSNIALTNNQYNAYKIFDVDNKVYTIANDSQWKKVVVDYVASLGADPWFELVSDTTDTTRMLVQVNNESTGDAEARAFADYLLAHMPTGITVDATTTATSADEATITVPSTGYYLVTGKGTADENQEVIAAAALRNVDGENVQFNLKAAAPTIEKKIVEENTEVDANTASIGDTVNYKITSAVPDMNGYKAYIFTVQDTLSKGLTINKTASNALNFNVKVGSVDKTSDFSSTITENHDGTTTIVIKADPTKFVQYTKGEEIVITYSAVVNENAVIGNEGNPNTVKLTYSNDPTWDGTGDGNDVTGETPDDTVKTYVTGIKITKVDENDKPLAGAKFELTGTKINKVVVTYTEFVEAADGTYYKLKDGTYTETVPSGVNDNQYESTTKKYNKTTKSEVKNITESVNITVTSGPDGIVSFEGLDAGTYTITETKAPTGYNPLKAPIGLTIESNVDEVNSASETFAWSVAHNEFGATVDATGLITFEVENKSGSELPETGGIGTTIFYVVGGLMMAVAVVLLVTKKKVNGK